MKGQYVLNKAGDPIPEPNSEKWGRWMQDADRHVAKNDCPNGLWVSTIFLGLDHQFGDGPPLLFETMVFAQGSWSELYCDRYSTREEAVAGHQKAVEWANQQVVEHESKE